MARTRPRQDGWKPFLIVAVTGSLGIYIASTLEIGTMQKTAAMAIIGIVVVAAYEHFIGWG